MHKIYEVMYEGFCEAIEGKEPDFDKHTHQFTGPAYEDGRQLAIIMMYKGLDTSEVDAVNIFNYKSKFRQELLK